MLKGLLLATLLSLPSAALAGGWDYTPNDYYYPPPIPSAPCGCGGHYGPTNASNVQVPVNVQVVQNGRRHAPYYPGYPAYYGGGCNGGYGGYGGGYYPGYRGW